MNTEDYALTIVYRRQRLQSALATLRSDYHRLIVILYLMGYGQGEIAEVYGMSRQAVQQHVAEFRRRNDLQCFGKSVL